MTRKQSRRPRKKGLTYRSAGVDYEVLDPFKIHCMERASKTAANCIRLGVVPLEWTRGESCYIVKCRGSYFGFVVETLGTKNIAADNFRQQLILGENLSQVTKKTYYDDLMQSTVAVNVNDLAPLGISPICVGMHAAVSSGEFFNDKERAEQLIEGWGKACDIARCIWAGGETPGLGALVMAGAGIFSGGAFGVSRTGHIIDSASIQAGDAITFLESNGIHDNGLSLARKIIEKLPEKYLTRLPDGRMCGEALLAPTHIYCDFVEDLLHAGINLHGAVNVTGHGFRKLMRAPQPLAYVVDRLPKVPAILKFLVKKGPVDLEEAYGTFNMGAGFALIHPRSETKKILELGKRYKDEGRYCAIPGGHVEASRRKKVVIPEKGIVFRAKSLAIRK